MIGVLEEAGTATARRMFCAEFHEIACPNLGARFPGSSSTSLLNQLPFEQKVSLILQSAKKNQHAIRFFDVAFKNANEILQRAVLNYYAIAGIEFLAEIDETVSPHARTDDGNDLAVDRSGLVATETDHVMDAPRETNLAQHCAGIKASENV